MKIKIYPPEQQASGSFEGGNITEQKPIGFPHEESVVQRVGPLFYWAWAHSKESGGIGLHPHKGFEIMTYVVNGKVAHGDTLGTKSVVGPGGAQVMQTGSGVSHEERVEGPDAEMFQIWFEPHLVEAYTRTPTYNEYHAEVFPEILNNDVRIKTIIGDGSPIRLVTDVQVWDIHMEPAGEYTLTIPAGYSIAALAIRGSGEWSDRGDEEKSAAFRHQDFIVLEAESDSGVRLKADREGQLRMIVIQVPTAVDYPLYRR